MSNIINKLENTITVDSGNSTITITDNSKSTSVNVVSKTNATVVVSAPGPKGDKGSQGVAGELSGTIIADNVIQPFTNITASANISASGVISGSTFHGDGSGLTGVTSYTNADTLTYINSINVLSGSLQIASDISGSWQGQNFISSSEVTPNLPNGTVSGSSQVILNDADKTGFNTDDVAEGTNKYYTDARVKTKLNTETVISGSSQVNYNSIQNQPTTITGDQANAITANTAKVGYTDAAVKTKLNTEEVVSGSASEVKTFLAITESDISDLTHYTDANVKTKIDAEGVFSGSSQVDVTSTTNYSSINQYSDSKVKTKLNTEEVLSGSFSDKLDNKQVVSGSNTNVKAFLAITESDISDLSHYNDTNVKTKLNTENVISGSMNITGTSAGLSGTPNITVGSIEATSLNVTSLTSSVITASVIETSGSNVFGDASSDTHTFIGNITSSGNISASGTATFNSLIAAGLTYPTTDGDDGNVLMTDGEGGLTLQSNVKYVNVKNVHGGTLAKGTPVHATGTSGNTPEVIAASSSVAASMPATFVLAEQLTNGSEGRAILSGFLNGINTSNGFTEGDVLYIAPDGGYTPDKPSGSNLIQNIAIIGKTDATNGSIFVYGSGRSNDTQNLLENHIFFGSGSNQQYQLHISGALDSTVINNITASGDISSSGNLIISRSLTFGEASAISNPNIIESNHLKIGAGTNDYITFTDNYVQVYADGQNVFAVQGGAQKRVDLNPNQLDVNVSINTDAANVFASYGSNDVLKIGGTTNYSQTASLVEHNADTFFRQGVTINNPNFNLGSGSAGLVVSGSGGHIYTTGHITASGNISSSGDFTGNSFIKGGGTSAQFLKADGSVDSTAYTTNVGDITGVTAGTGLDGGATSGNATLTLDLTEVGFGGQAGSLVSDDGDGTVTSHAGLKAGADGTSITGSNIVVDKIVSKAQTLTNSAELTFDTSQTAKFFSREIEIVSINTSGLAATQISSSNRVYAGSYYKDNTLIDFDNYLTLATLPSGILSGSEPIASDISGSWQGQNFISASEVTPNLPTGVISSSQHTFTAITSSGDIVTTQGITANTLDISDSFVVNTNKVQVTAGHNLSLGSAFSSTTGRLDISHDDSEGIIQNRAGDFTIMSFASNTILANQGSNGKIILAPNASSGGLDNTGEVLVSGSAENGIRLSVAGNVTASGNISASGYIYSRQVEQHDMVFNGTIDTSLLYMPFGGQSLLEQTANTNVNVQKVAVVQGKPRKVVIRGITPAASLGSTSYTCSYLSAIPGQSAVNSIAKKYATTAGTNHEAVTFDFTSGVDEGTWNDVTEGSRVYMAIQADASITPGTVAVCALWEWDYSTI